MKRRSFLTLLCSAAVAWPLAAGAQQTPMPVIGWMSSRNAATDALVLPAFRRALSAHGFVEGRNLRIEYRFVDGRIYELPNLAKEFVRIHVALVAAVGDGPLSTQALRAVDPAIPVVFVSGGDPVISGIVPNLNRPGGYTTGVVAMQGMFGSKRLGLLHDLLPRATRIAALFAYNAKTEMVSTLEAARQLGLQIDVLKATTDAEIDDAFLQMQQMKAEALYVGVNPFFFARATKLVSAAARLALPGVYFRREFAEAGGLMSYGTDATETYRVLGDYAGRILKGEKAGDLPVQQASKFELLINLKAAKALGITIPPTLSALADEIIE